MAYTALEKMRLRNKEQFGIDVGPMQPTLSLGDNENDLKSTALRFIHERCECLKFNDGIAEEEKHTGVYHGTSLLPNQIPYNMEMDINRLCLERELEKFIDSGVAEDAYTVYYCYLKMFFGRYGKSKRMVELLSEFESNGGSLLMKHRDHYSHSVYVFAMGLAIYESNEHFRKAFKEFYKFNDEKNDCISANAFLEYWGLTALFHDIGYPFELPFEQVLSYFEVRGQKRQKGNVYIAYHDLDSLTKLDKETKTHFEKLYRKRFDTVEELFAHAITKRLGKTYDFSEEYLLEIIREKPVSPNKFGYYMDHAYFSAVQLFKELIEVLGVDMVNEMHMDAFSAILLHNSMFKFAISFYNDEVKNKEPLQMKRQPLAFLLMICDELQCWDRTAYGRNSRAELHPMAADFDFGNNSISVTYFYDKEEQDKIDAYQKLFDEWKKSGKENPPRLKAYSDMAEKGRSFTKTIMKIVDTSPIPLSVYPSTRVWDRKRKHTFLSTSNFLHLYDFAISLNGRYSYLGNESEVPAEQLESEFNSLSLEYQLSNINQAKNFGKYLNALGCLYTDKPVDFEMITMFMPEQMEIIAPMEHERWIREHISMAWKYGDLYETIPLEHTGIKEDEKKIRKALREQFRMHKLAMDGNPSTKEIIEHYRSLPDVEKGKDSEPFNSMLKLIKKFDGLRIYSLNF